MVVAVEQAVAAPLATCRLADAGARVVKVERPGSGDFARHYDRFVKGQSTYFTWLNRGKESVQLDLKTSEGLEALLALVDGADVFVQNLSLGAAQRGGYGSVALLERNPRLVAVDICGYGETGPKASMPAYDLLVQAESGLCATSGPPGAPARIGASIVDISTGLNVHGAVMEALFERERTGRGRIIKTSLFASAVSPPLLSLFNPL